MSDVQAKINLLNQTLKSLIQERINMAHAISSKCTSIFAEELKCVQKNKNKLKQVHALQYQSNYSELKTTFGRNLNPGNFIWLKYQLKNTIK